VFFDRGAFFAAKIKLNTFQRRRSDGLQDGVLAGMS
jgi:hypothetical protein